MVDAIISVVLEQLIPYGVNKVTLVAEIREEVEKLTSNLTMVQEVLVDADEKQVKSKSVRLWLDNLKQVVYDADDVLDEWLTRAAISQIQIDVHVTAGTRNKVLSYLLSPCFCFKHVIVRYDIGHQIKVINKRLDLISKQRTDFGLKVIEVHQNHGETRQLTSSVVDVSKIRGRDQAKKDIVNRLLGESSSQGEALRVFSIVGIGGLGKTTLAKLIFHERRVVETFKTKMWVCVSEPFNRVEVAKAVIKEVTGRVPDSSVWQEVHNSLCESVKGKQFLLVLDDVWTEDPRDWKPLQVAFNGGALGSRIIVTTRNKTVAKRMGCTDPDIHDLEILSEDDSWSVIKDVALVGRAGEELEVFEKLGRKIATKCKGIPLAITILASLLCERQKKKEWEDVLASDLWDMPDIIKYFLPSLFLSYYSFDPISKQCFQYSAIFPKDFQIEKDQLIKLWMGQGFFGFGKTNDLERIGEDHFRFLTMRSFFQDFKKDSDENITSCKMHDLVHDFAMYISHNEYSHLQVGGTISDSYKIRHLYTNDLKIPSILKGRKLRTLVCRQKTAVPIDLFNKLACLRTLVLRDSKMEVLPVKVEKLIHLRYLDLSGSRLNKLPETICNLYNLQVLALNHCRNLYKLPEKIGKLINLRHLEIEGTCDDLSCFPKSIAALSSLRTLSKFVVSGADDDCKIGDLQLLNNLQGALELKGLGRVTDGNEVDRAEFKKKNLRVLTFDFGRGIRMKSILEKLEPHEDLEILEINGYSDSHFPAWVQSCSLLTNLVEMRLYGCNLCTELPAFGKLGCLQTLLIREMGSVRRIGHEFYGFDAHQMTAFPKLVSFAIEDMAKLEEWEVPVSKDTNIMPLLVEKRLQRCPMLRALPCLGSLESLERLNMREMGSVRRIGHEFYGFGAHQMTTFPKLVSFAIEDMAKLEEWEVPILKDTKIMPLLVEIQLENCPMLRALPDLGSLESLEKLKMVYLTSVTYIGDEFYGFGADRSLGLNEKMIAFPKLKTLQMIRFDEMEEWDIPIWENRKTMPFLSQLVLSNFPKLRAFPRVWRMESLEELELAGLDSVGGEFGKEGSLQQDGVTFPKLKKLHIQQMLKLEEWSVPLIVPCLEELVLRGFPKLKTLPTFQGCMGTLESLQIDRMEEWEGQEKLVIVSDKEGGSSSSSQGCGLRVLQIINCPKLRVVPKDYMFSPSLRELELWGDVGDLYNSFPTDDTLCSITKVTLSFLQYSSLPKGFDQLKSLQSLEFYICSTLDFDLKEGLGHFTELQYLKIKGCPDLAERFKGDVWRTIFAHVPKIIINETPITKL